MTELLSPEYKFTAVLIAIHWTPLLIAAWKWPLKKLDFSFSSAVTLLFTIVAWLIVVVCFFLFFDVRANGNMTWAAAYIIYAVVTLGVVPIAIIAIHVFAGRSAGLWIRSRWRKRQSGGTQWKTTSTFGR